MDLEQGLRGYKILLVEANPGLLDMYELMISALGASVVRADGVERARSLLRSATRWHALVFSLNLPNAHLLVQDARAAHLPLLGISHDRQQGPVAVQELPVLYSPGLEAMEAAILEHAKRRDGTT